MEECYSPLNYSIEKAISSRILNPTAPVPSFPQILEKERQQPEELQEKSKPYLDYLKRVADVKKGTMFFSILRTLLTISSSP